LSLPHPSRPKRATLSNLINFLKHNLFGWRGDDARGPVLRTGYAPLANALRFYPPPIPFVPFPVYRERDDTWNNIHHIHHPDESPSRTTIRDRDPDFDNVLDLPTKWHTVWSIWTPAGVYTERSECAGVDTGGLHFVNPPCKANS